MTKTCVVCKKRGKPGVFISSERKFNSKNEEKEVEKITLATSLIKFLSKPENEEKEYQVTLDVTSISTALIPTAMEASVAEIQSEQQIPEEKTNVEPPAPPDESQKRLSSSGKRASIDVRSKPDNDITESFTPPDMKSQKSSGSGARRASSGEGRRISMSDRGLDKSPSSAGKARFGGLSSKARMVLGSIVDIKTNAAEYFDKKVAKYQNTYQLESTNPFNPEKVNKILREVMDEVMENLRYDPEKCASTAKAASIQIRGKVKQLDFERYKLICIVSIGERNSQDVYATCRFLWDPEKDRYAFYSLENTQVYGIAYCFGLYYE